MMDAEYTINDLVELEWDYRLNPSAEKRYERSVREDIKLEYALLSGGVLYVRALNSAGEREYDLALGKNMNGGCSCPDFMHRGRYERIPCKHLFKLIREAAGMLKNSRPLRG